ncbi:Phospholipase C [Pseudogymnoascus destructans]|uniref:Phospholipase C n=1 Tax=Pseudogymnoascus destructans TaxID=655981 RepID=A0A177ANN0_9PEZI|nr:Phospholipase C [Pseudogymnoascus destructans]OAF62941.1 Phospholipase C [Pseudogymnoascus destructans]
MVMVPSQKWTWIEDNWENYWIKIAKKQVQELWDTEYKPVQLPPPPRVEISIEEKTEHQIWLEQKRRRPLVLDEYMKYCGSPITSDVNARAWWMEPAQRAAFPNLGRMALDLLSIPAMSPCGRKAALLQYAATYSRKAERGIAEGVLLTLGEQHQLVPSAA